MRAIVAMDMNRVIGYKGEIPWHIPEDFKWFKKMTMGQHLIMGRTTYKSVGILPGRFTYILTNNAEKLKLPYANACGYIDYNTLNFLDLRPDRMWVCGGAKTYQLLLPHCTDVYVTLVLDEYKGDTYMPEFESKFPNSEIIKETRDYWIIRYWK